MNSVFGCFSWEEELDTEYDRAKVPPNNGNDPPPAPGSLKAFLFPSLIDKVQNKGTQGVRARYGAELPSIHFHCPVPRSSSHIAHGRDINKILPKVRFTTPIVGHSTQRRKKYTPPPWRPSSFSFSGSEALWCIPFFPDLW